MLYFIIDSALGIVFQVDTESACRILETAYWHMTCVVRLDA